MRAAPDLSMVWAVVAAVCERFRFPQSRSPALTKRLRREGTQLGVKSPSLTMSALSSLFLGTPLHALVERAPFRSRRWFCALQPGLASNRSGSATQSDPAISSITNCDHDYLFELPQQKGAGCPIITSVITAHHRDFRALPRANRTYATGRSRGPSATSSTDAPPACGPSPPWRSSAHAASLDA